jgi:hypothetical protein
MLRARRLRLVSTWPKTNLPSSRVKARRTTSLRSSRSMSAHRRPRASPPTQAEAEHGQVQRAETMVLRRSEQRGHLLG